MERPCPSPSSESFLFIEDNISELFMRSGVSPVSLKIAGAPWPWVSGLALDFWVFGEVTRSPFPSTSLRAMSSEVISSP